jgi:hypothetical protein
VEGGMIMRDIIFRAKGVEGNWHEGLLTHLPKEHGKYGEHVEPGYYISNKAGRPFAFSVQGFTIGQYTGIDDTNEKKIFEGDVVKVYVPAGYGEAISVVVWGKQSRGWSLKCHYPNRPWTKIKYYAIPAPQNIEVIGNIYDNPELLEVKEQCTNTL